MSTPTVLDDSIALRTDAPGLSEASRLPLSLERPSTPGSASHEKHSAVESVDLRKHRIWIFEDNRMFRDLLAGYLTTLPNLEIVGNAEDEPALLAAVAARRVDVVILDLNLSGRSGLEVLENLSHRRFSPHVLILSGTLSIQSVHLALHYGAVGYLEKSAPLAELASALAKVAAGEFYFGARPERIVPQGVSLPAIARESFGLTTRQAELLTRLARGQSVAEIAADHGLSCFAIYKRRKRLMHLLNARNGGELIAHAARHGRQGGTVAGEKIPARSDGQGAFGADI